MSGENVGLVRQAYEAFRRRDVDRWRQLFSPDVIWDMSGAASPAVTGVYHGHEGMESFLRRWVGTWDEFSIETRELIDAGDSVVVVFRQSGRGKGSGVEVAQDFFGVYDVRDRKIVRYRECPSREAALQAAGIET